LAKALAKGSIAGTKVTILTNPVDVVLKVILL
jgi:hypothetical protein